MPETPEISEGLPATLDGTLDIVRGQREAKAAYPDDYDKMAREIDAENEERDKTTAKPAK